MKDDNIINKLIGRQMRKEIKSSLIINMNFKNPSPKSNIYNNQIQHHIA